MRLEVIAEEFSVCKVARLEDAVAALGTWTFVGATDGEISLVCPCGRVPAQTMERSDGWRAFRVAGMLDFSLVGILAELSRVLAEAKVGIFAVSTFDTDYILTKEADFEHALDALRAAGHEVVELDGTDAEGR